MKMKNTWIEQEHKIKNKTEHNQQNTVPLAILQN